MTRRRDILALSGALAVGSLAGCLGVLSDGGVASGTELRADVERETPTEDDERQAALVAGNTQFAFDLYADLVGREGGNLFASPYSISVALAMTYAGARGETATQMADAMQFVDADRLHPGFNALDRAVDPPDGGDDTSGGEGEEGEPFRLDTVNAVWGLEEYPYSEAYLETLARHYGAGLRVVDFVGEPEASRETINEWVAEQTEDRIEDLLPRGSIDDLTRLVLTNAIYFKANWTETFSADRTEDAPFRALDGSTGSVPMMSQSATFPYAEVDGAQVVELPYVGGDVGMVVMLPPEGEFESFEADLDAERLGELTDALEQQKGSLSFPRFTLESSFGLTEALSALGMPSAFDPQQANFDGMVDRSQTSEPLYLSDVVHKSFVTVDEEGTEAAAATGVVAGTTSAPLDPFEMTVDRPFVFAIRHRPTGAVLFLGRVVDGAAAQ